MERYAAKEAVGDSSTRRAPLIMLRSRYGYLTYSAERRGTARGLILDLPSVRCGWGVSGCAADYCHPGAPATGPSSSGDPVFQ